jgi:hypothetical protein
MIDHNLARAVIAGAVVNGLLVSNARMNPDQMVDVAMEFVRKLDAKLSQHARRQAEYDGGVI